MTLEQCQTITLEALLEEGDFSCSCGTVHSLGTPHVILEKGAVARIPELLRLCGAKKPFLLSGNATFQAAGEAVCAVLKQNGILYSQYVFPHSPVLPTEASVGSAVMHFDDTCDVIIGIGSGVINDIGKLLAKATGRTYLIVGTAPSMDGYASPTSSMELDGLKVSINSTFAWAIIGDLDILCQAPLYMIQSGVGDMLAKYISICEWRIGQIVTGEYYCPVIAQLVETALENCIQAGPDLLRRDPEAVKAVMEGMVLAGMAMHYAGVTRPASGVEHYFSHIWDMRSLAFGTPSTLHGIQCGVGTLYALQVYDILKTYTPNREQALTAAAAFCQEDWNQKLTDFIGPGSVPMIEAARKEQKYDLQLHAKRLDRIIDRWEEIQGILRKLPSYAKMKQFLQALGAPTEAGAFGVTHIHETFRMTKDIRNKYVVSQLLWDLGILDQVADQLF